VDALKDPEAKVRAAASQSLGSFKEHVKLVIAPLLERSRDDDAGVRREVALALGNLGKSEPGVEQALKSLEQDSDSVVRMNAGVSLALLGGKDAASIPLLLAGLKSDHEVTSRIAGRALRPIAKETPDKVLPGLKEVLATGNQVSLENALGVLRAMKSEAGPLLPDLAALFDKAGPESRAELVVAIPNLDPKGDYGVAILSKAFKDSDHRVRREAILGVLTYRDKAASFVDPLIRSLKDSDQENQLLALRMLRSVGSDAAKALGPVINLTKHPDLTVRAFAIGTLGSFRPVTDEMMKALEKALGDQELSVRRSAVDALRRLGTIESEKVFPVMVQALKMEKDPGLKQMISGALKSMADRAGKPVELEAHTSAPRTESGGPN